MQKARLKLAMNDALCEQCNEVMKPESVHEITSDGEFIGEKLTDIGIPDHDIVQIRSNNKRGFFMLETAQPDT